MKKYVLVYTFVVALFASILTTSRPAFATTRYIAQTAGTFTGGTVCNGQTTITPATFNGITNSPGDVDYVCGTITGSAGSQLLAPQGNGNSTSPITLKFDAGAILEAPYFSSADGAINVSGLSYIVVDGGTNGIIQNTANGTGFANQANSTAINANPCSNCEFKNLTIRNIYVHTSASDDGEDQTQMRCIYIGGSNWKVDHNTMHDAGWCIYEYHNNGDTGGQVYSNEVYNVDHGVVISGYGAVSASNISVYDNYIHDFANWDTTSDSYHHDGIHAYGTSGSNVTGLYIYDNKFGGDPGSCCFTSFIYIEKPDSSASVTNFQVYNNVLDGSSSTATFGLLGIGDLGGTNYVFNNTIIGTNSGSNYCILLNGSTSEISNNILTGCNTFIYEYGPIPSVTLNHNTYAAVGSVGWYASDGSTYSTLASWRTASGQDAASQLATSADLSNYIPQSGSPALGAATNLTSQCAGFLVPLCSDYAGNARPSTGAWIAGAYQALSGPVPAPPVGLTGTVVVSK